MARRDYTNDEFISMLGDFCDRHKQEFLDLGIYPSVFIGQAAIESGWGNSNIAKECNNFHGMTAGSSWSGARYTASSKLVFRKYNTIEDGLSDYLSFLSNDRYKNGRNQDHPYDQINNIGHAWEGTNNAGQYINDVIKTIKNRDFFQFDKKIYPDKEFLKDYTPKINYTSVSSSEIYNYITSNYKEGDLVDTSKIIKPTFDDFYLNEIEIANQNNKYEYDTKLEPYGHKMMTDESHGQTDSADTNSDLLSCCIDNHIDFNSLKYNSKDHYFLLKANPMLNDESKKLNHIDGDTVKFSMDSVVGGNESFKIGEVEYQSFKEYVKANSSTESYQNNDLDFTVRFLGLDAPEIPHYSKIDSTDKCEIKEYKYKNIKTDNHFVFEKKEYNDNDMLTFIRFKEEKGDYWHQYFPNEKKILTKDESDLNTLEDGYKAQKIVIDMLEKANETYVMLDAVTLSNDGFKYNNKYKSRQGLEYNETYNNFVDFMFSRNGYKFLGFNIFGQDMYKRFLGVIYINIDKKYLPEKYQNSITSDSVTINLNKYLINNVDLEVLPDFNSQPIKTVNNNFVSEAFRLWEYNIKSPTEQKLQELFAKLDDRQKIQEQIFNTNFANLKDWTVIIGDTTLFVPPTSIRSIAQNTSERAPLIRAKGSITKDSPKSDRFIEMTLYFNDDQGINGYPYEETLPNGEKITYYMNGLRSLISQFKFTPFLPIENNYINDVLGIEAVTLSNLQITTMPNYPKCIAATLTLEDFNYRVYMPELTVDTDIELFANTNYFAKTINFPTMRWYYQQAIINGEKINEYDLNNYDIYPEELIEETLGNKTALAPMKHLDSNIIFYIPDEEMLKQKLQIKTEASKKAITNTFKHTEESIYFVKSMDNIYKKIKESIPFNKNLYETFGNKQSEVIENMINKIKELDCVNDAQAKTNSKGYKITISFDQKITESELDSLKKYLLGDTIYKFNDFYKDSKITLDLNLKNSDIVFDSNQPDCLFLAKCSQLVLDNGEINNIQDNIDNIKEGIDLEKYDSMQFVKYDIDDVNIANISCAYQNVLSKISLNGIDGYAPQYIGGQDTVIDIMFQTTNKSVAAQLYTLPRLIAEQIRTYREVITSWPLRISSDITNLLGVYEVVVENVQMDTVPNQPGVYNIQMRLISVDRTLRNREALIKIDNINNEGYQGDSVVQYKDLRTYFDFQRAISEVEVYPDLELPTIKDLNNTGLPYIKNKNQPEQKYADPDFYFLYSHTLFSEIIRDGIVEFFKNYDQVTKDYDITDNIGSKVGINFDGSEEVYRESYANDKYIEESDTIDEFLEESTNNMASNESEQLDNDTTVLTNLNMTSVKDSWNIADNVKTVLLEDQFVSSINDKESNVIKDQYKQHEAVADQILKFLEEKPMSHKVTYSNDDQKVYSGEKEVYGKPQTYSLSTIESTVKDCMKTIEYDSGIKNLNNIGIDRDKIAKLISAAAVAASAEREFNDGDNKEASNPRNFYDEECTLPVGIVCGGTQDFNNSRKPTSIKDAVDNGLIVSMYGINIKELSDPYYAKLSAGSKELFEYKYFCITNHVFATEAFCRLCLYYYAKMIKDKILPSITVDIQKDAVDSVTHTKVEVETNSSADIIEQGAQLDAPVPQQIGEDLNRSNTVNTVKTLSKDTKKAVKQKEKVDKKNKDSYRYGNVFPAVLLALTNGNNEIYSSIRSKGYNRLNQYKEAMLSGEYDLSAETTDTGMSHNTLFRRFVLALVKVGITKKIDGVFVNTPNSGDIISQCIQEKLYISAADNPSEYILHSFFDMISNDKRGRMLRAFPTFYMCFIDEGYKMGVWKLTDNFYNYNAISEIQITKSRKIAADTAKITMSNLFNTFTTDDEDTKENYEYNFKDVLQSYFHPYEDYQKRKELQKDFSSVEKAKLKPGSRIHVRMGYGANAATLPIAFNGCISEVATGPFVTVVAQGDGVELMNPITIKKDAEDLQNDEKAMEWFTNLFVQSETPKTVLTSILAYRGGFLNKTISELTDGRFGNQNPFGIAHFGNPNNTEIFLNSEISQNIYEGSAASPWNKNDSIASLYSDSTAPKLTFNLFGKTPWEVMHICGSASPDYVVGIVPFGLRSSIFHGAPRYYCAYDYINNYNTLYEKRKPYQQFHVYTSFSDIIANGITVTGKDMKTAAIGTYIRGGSKSTNQQSVGPLWADFMIYPEKQKTMIYNTNLMYKGIGTFFKVLWINNIIDYFSDDTGLMQSGYKIAWRMTANALKDSIKDMYQGEMIVLGDPTIKPNDRVFVSDTYENMSGSCLVEAVVQNMSVETGYTTTFIPDAIAVVDDRYELELQSMAGKSIVQPLSAYFATVTIGTLLCGAKKPFIRLTGKTIGTIGKNLTKASTKHAFGEKILSGAGKFVSETGKKTTEALTASASAGATTGALVGMAIEMAFVFIATEYAKEALERKMMNYRVLQIFPLKKNGIPFTAGLNGAKGLVFGSPSYEDAGFIGELFDKMFIKHADDAWWVKALKGFFVPENIEEIAMKYQKNNYLIDENGTPTQEIAMSGIGEILSSKELNNQSTANHMSEYANANIPSQDLVNYSYVYDSSTLKMLHSNGSFKTLHETNPIGIASSIKTYKIKNNERTLTALMDESKTIYNLPIVNDKIIPVLEYITTKTAETNKKSKVILTSGIQLNTTQQRTSDTCTVSIVNISDNEIDSIIDNTNMKYRNVNCTKQKIKGEENICILLRIKSETTSSHQRLKIE